MKRTKRTLSDFASAVFLVVLASPLLSFAGQSAGVLNDIQVSFKLDPRLSGPTYGGERWISPPTFTAAAAQDAVEAKAHGVDARGNLVPIGPQWIPSDPEMVTVSPGKDETVKITVQRAGESRMQVKFQGVSKELVIKAENRGNALQFEIAQLAGKPAAETAAAPEPPAPNSSVASTATGNSGALKSHKEKISYVLGANLGTGIRKQSLDVDHALVVQGLRDALASKPMLLTEHEVAVIMAVLQTELRQKQVTLAAEKIVATKELGEKNKKAGETFLAENKATEGVVTLESGLQYKVLKTGDGTKPAPDDTVVCHYRGALLDGTEFDSSYGRDKPATFPLNRVIKGWNQALQLMPVGSKWQLFVPPALAYGERGANGSIGPNATLIFEVELVSIQEKSSQSGSQTTSQPPLARRPLRATRSR